VDCSSPPDADNKNADFLRESLVEYARQKDLLLQEIDQQEALAQQQEVISQNPQDATEKHGATENLVSSDSDSSEPSTLKKVRNFVSGKIKNNKKKEDLLKAAEVRALKREEKLAKRKEKEDRELEEAERKRKKEEKAQERKETEAKERANSLRKRFLDKVLRQKQRNEKVGRARLLSPSDRCLVYAFPASGKSTWLKTLHGFSVWDTDELIKDKKKKRPKNYLDLPKLWPKAAFEAQVVVTNLWSPEVLAAYKRQGYKLIAVRLKDEIWLERFNKRKTLNEEPDFDFTQPWLEWRAQASKQALTDRFDVLLKDFPKPQFLLDDTNLPPSAQTTSTVPPDAPDVQSVSHDDTTSAKTTSNTTSSNGSSDSHSGDEDITPPPPSIPHVLINLSCVSRDLRARERAPWRRVFKNCYPTHG